MALRFLFILLASCCLVFNAKAAPRIDVKTYIPKNAPALLPLVKTEQQRVFPKTPIVEYIGGLVEQESCISLTHSRCWSPVSELKTDREQGIGLFQITRAYHKTGAVRFDTLKDLRMKYPEELNELSWENVRLRPDLQIRSGLLLTRDNYEALWQVPDPVVRLQMADSAYNGGLRNVKKARTACGLAANCNPDIWFNNVEIYLPQSRAAMYGSRSAYDINREHVATIFRLRMAKYKPALTSLN